MLQQKTSAEFQPNAKDAPKHPFDVTGEELKILASRRPNPEGKSKFIMFLVGALLTPVTFIGALLGYVRGYNRFMWPEDEFPVLGPLRPIVRVSMIIGAALLWVILFVLLLVLIEVIGGGTLQGVYMFLSYIGVNLFICLIAFLVFRRWQVGINNALVEGGKFGSARFARADELTGYSGNKSFYIGGGYSFNDKGHILTVAGTRGGKGTNLIIPNLLGASDYQGSWVVIDPKGENAAITKRFQLERGQKVVILNPWGLLADELGPAQRYNPLDILADKSNVNLVDDIQMIAEMIVPIDKNDKDKFFTDNARSIVAGLLLHLVLIQEPVTGMTPIGQTPYQDDEDRAGREMPPATLKTLWQWVRLADEEWMNLIADMQVNDDKKYGNTVKQASLEIQKLMAAGDRTWGTIIAVVLQCTDFIKSPALQESLKSGFDPKELSDGKTTLYVIIPADKLQSHSRWLRLVSTTTMRAVVRKPNKRVCFLLDEFSALGYLPEIEVALSTYAGFEITVWPILQSLIQLQAHYKDTWETFIGNSTIRQFFSVNDNFTADYVSKAIGQTSHVIIDQSWGGIIEKSQSNQRPLVTTDELRRASGHNIFAFMGEKPITYYPKMPYYLNPELMKRADANPYFR